MDQFIWFCRSLRLNIDVPFVWWIFQAPRETTPVTFVKEEELIEEKKPAFDVLTRLVTYTLQHQTDIVHTFHKCRSGICDIKLLFYCSITHSFFNLLKDVTLAKIQSVHTKNWL